MKKRCCDKETSRRPFFFFRPQILVRFIIHVFFVFQLLPAFIEGADQFTEGGGGGGYGFLFRSEFFFGQHKN
jgi:hypothetical protein